MPEDCYVTDDLISKYKTLIQENIEERESTEKELKEIENKIKSLEKGFLKLKEEKTLLENVSKREGLPPNFEIRWWHRHDPFNSVWVLYLNGEKYKTADSDGGDVLQKAYLTQIAWQAYNQARKIIYGNEN